MNQKIAVGIVFVSAMFMNIMDITIVNVALPTIGRDLHVAATAVSAVSIGYLVSLAVVIPASMPDLPSMRITGSSAPRGSPTTSSYRTRT